MTISYNWLCDYLPDELKAKPTPEKLAEILTSVGLEVESLTQYESVKGLFDGLVVGEVLNIETHPNADKLKVARVNAGGADVLQIVCGASNVAAGQKVVVALPGSTLYPVTGQPLVIRTAKIRSVESQGMLCAEDEIGLGKSHAGILVLPQHLRPGSPVAEYLKPYTDHLYEIGLTPNHMDAMSHTGVAREICAYLSHHDKKEFRIKLPASPVFATGDHHQPVSVRIENRKACARYTGIRIRDIVIRDSPGWMQNKLKAIGVRPVNNVVDITNFVLHETGQPLHAYDAERVRGGQIIIKNLPAGTSFTTLDGKERKLDAEDLMICDAERPLCIAGIFGGLDSGITESSTSLFLESAWFAPTGIRRSSFRHGLRTDAAIHFEKGMDISGTIAALKRAAALIGEYAGGQMDTDITDTYPEPLPKDQILLKYHYLKKLSGKNYRSVTVKNILLSLGFDILRENMDELLIAAPQYKPDIQLPADVVEEIMRIDGYDNIEIPSSITISPSVETDRDMAALQEKVSGYLTGLGFSEIFTNSITNSAYFTGAELETSVKMINNLSAELDIMRPSLLETGLESINWNINRKNNALRFFEFGKSYHTHQTGKYQEVNHCCLYITGNLYADGWKGKSPTADFFSLKGICENILKLSGVDGESAIMTHPKLSAGLQVFHEKSSLIQIGQVNNALLERFDIRQPVYYADFNWDNLTMLSARNKIRFTELPRQNPVNRDLALIVEKSLPFERVVKTLRGIGLEKLQQVQLFDIFESEKLGKDKKSLAVSFTFLDPEKTLTDKEIDGMMDRIMKTAELELKAEIRR